MELKDAPWRFRTNWRGQLILQRFFPAVFNFGGCARRECWRDATATDLLDYAAWLAR